MPDQYTAVLVALEKMGVANNWHIVEPEPGYLRDNVWIRNKDQRLDTAVEVSPVDVQFLDEDEMVKRIQVAMLKADLRH